MINIAPNVWIVPDHIEEVQLTKNELYIFMISGRMHQITNNIADIMKEIEDFMMDIEPEPKPKRKYTKKEKKE